MRKLFFGLLLSAILLPVVNAQEMSFGVKGGLNMSKFLDFDFEGNYKLKPGYHIGAIFELPLSKKVSLQPEVIYSSQGTIYNDSFYNNFGYEVFEETNTTVNNLYIPIILKIKPTDAFSIEVGPHIGFLLSAEREVEYIYWNDDISNNKSDIKRKVNEYDYGINIGFAYKLDSGLLFSIRYNAGLADVLDNAYEQIDFGDFTSQYNQVLQISLGYMFN